MEFTIVTIGKIKENFIDEGIKEYQNRINRYTRLTLFPVKEERLLKGVSEALVMQKEGKRILEKIPHNGYWIALDRQGREMSSRQHFDFLNAQAEKGIKKIYYMIGGPLGLSPEVLQQANRILSLSQMTLPHEMSALFLMEQLYRYLNFMAGEKYHK